MCTRVQQAKAANSKYWSSNFAKVRKSLTDFLVQLWPDLGWHLTWHSAAALSHPSCHSALATLYRHQSTFKHSNVQATPWVKCSVLHNLCIYLLALYAIMRQHHRHSERLILYQCIPDQTGTTRRLSSPAKCVCCVFATFAIEMS